LTGGPKKRTIFDGVLGPKKKLFQNTFQNDRKYVQNRQSNFNNSFS